MLSIHLKSYGDDHGEKTTGGTEDSSLTLMEQDPLCSFDARSFTIHELKNSELHKLRSEIRIYLQIKFVLKLLNTR